MKTKHSFSIDFIIRRCKDNKKEALLYARITVDEERKEISLKERINATDWDPRQRIVKGRSESAKSLNKHIEDVRFKIKEKYRLLCDRETLVTAETIKQAYLGTHASLKGHKLVELLDYYHKIWQPKLKPGGFKNVVTTIAYVKRFLAKEYTGGDIYLSQLSMELATNYEHFVRNNPMKAHDRCEGNGLAKHVQRFKRIVNWAVEIKWIQINPFKEYSCPQKRHRRKKLSFQQLVAIEQQAFSDPSICYVKDLFLHSCYTGFAFADAMALREEHFEWDTDGTVWCKIYRLKSDELAAVPILKSAATLLRKYKGRSDYKPGGSIFPRITNQEVNRCLKVIQAVCGVDFSLTFHIARHTFAKTVALKNGIPLETVQIMLGHAKITTTQIYADVDEEKVLDDTIGWQERLDRKREIVLASQLMQRKRTRFTEQTDDWPDQ
ncbi:MAG TPA: site-specific integrase [Puia sp.]|uniref:site-specific integrase n=1 Tax=Puia sp. TaxID=2045100 RepID=UPI002CCF54BA|nr:site-specific integrase [Puia sp.]HVU96166.1 site-specific integrase [Puia sp.]